MSAPGKFDYSSAAPLYRSNFAAQMERSSSFPERPAPSSHPNMLRGTSPLAQTDVTNFFQCLRFDPKVVAADHKSIRQGDFKRHVNFALGIQGDESPSTALKGKLIPEEIKRLKASLRENNVKARERVKIFNEASSVFNKFFPSVPTKKRSRPEGFSGDRLASGSGLSKMGIQGQILAGGFELDQQMLDERPKSGVPNKRTRTSMMDVRSKSIVRQSAAAVDRDKEIMRMANHNAVQGEERTSLGIDGWEKSKMKKKRSCIKTDCHPNLASSKVVDGYRDLKQSTQQKSMGDSRTRLNGDSNMLRQVAGNGATEYGRSDNLSQQTSLAGYSPLSRGDSDHNYLYLEKRERSIGSDKERVNLRAVNKSNVHDEFNSSSLVSNTKPNASVHGPRTGTGLPPKLSPGLRNTPPSPSDWDISGCTNKPPPVSGVTHRKRMTSNRSSSPPITQWASQRPQKISRTARRTSLVPIVSNKDETYLDNISDAGCSDTGFEFYKRSPAASPQLKIRGESSFSTAALSESEESGPPEIKSKDKGKQSDEVDGKAAHNIPKVSIPALQSRKGNKRASGEEIGDGVRRQGRTGRGGFSSTRSLNPVGVEKLKNVGTTKQLRSARTILDKSESKVGRPPTRKLSDRKAYSRQRATATNASPLDFHDDGHEELQAAVNSAVNFAQNFPNSFWKQMDRYFCFISDDHINFMKHQGELFSMGPSPVLTPPDFDSRDLYPEELATRSVDSKASPLYHRLLSALISEDSMSVNEDLQVDEFGAMHDLDDHSEFSVLMNNGFRNHEWLEHDESEDAILFKGVNNSAYHCNDKFSDHSPIDFSNIPYDKLGIDEKIYLEAQSIGISLEPMPSISNVEDEGIVDEIKKLKEAICKEGSKKKEMVDRLLKPALEMRETQEKELDQLGYDKLIEMAYEKSKASRRHHTVAGKNSANKISKQAASAFVKRTLERCRQFEETGKSCFSEPEIKDMFIARLATAPADKEDNPSTSTPIGSQPSSTSLARVGQNLENYANCSDAENALRERTIGREDTVWSNRVKKRELLLDDVGIIGTQLSSSTKGKRSERDRDGKGQASSRSGTNKIGRPSLSSTNGERKPKAKPKQLDQGHEVDIYDSRTFIGGKVGSFVDRRGNHIEMGLHVFFGCYNNLFRLMKKVGADKNLLVKDHTHTFINKGSEIGELDFRFPVGAPIHGIRAFLVTNQLKPYDKLRNSLALALSPVVKALVNPDGAMKDIRNLDSISFSDWFLSKGGTRASIQRMWDPVAYALGFIDCDNMSARCMLTIFSLFATKTEASLLRMLKGSPDTYLSGPIKQYITDRGGRIHLRWGCREILYDKTADGETYVTGLAVSKATDKKVVKADVYVAACDVPGIKRLLPKEWRESRFFNDIYELEGVPVCTVQLRYNGWVTELEDIELSRQLKRAVGLDNLLYTPDADFSCFADLALASPADYYIEGQGSLLQCVLTPGDPYMRLPNDKIIEKVAMQVTELFPSSRGLEVTWSSVVKIAQSLYREAPGKDPFRPDQKTPVKNFFLAGSYTKQDYIDSMEGATLSGRQASSYICDAGEELAELNKKLSSSSVSDELSLV